MYFILIAPPPFGKGSYCSPCRHWPTLSLPAQRCSSVVGVFAQSTEPEVPVSITSKNWVWWYVLNSSTGMWIEEDMKFIAIFH